MALANAGFVVPFCVTVGFFFFLMLGLGLSECLSRLYLVVDMADGCVLWDLCTCVSEVSAFLGRTQKKRTQNSQSYFRYGQ